MSAPGEDAEANRELLHHEQDRDQDKLQKQQPVAPLDPGLAGGDDAANVGVGQHDHDARPHHREEPGQRPGAG
jgi:hypothetical protein